jgi:hypothetical protein
MVSIFSATRCSSRGLRLDEPPLDEGGLNTGGINSRSK